MKYLFAILPAMLLAACQTPPATQEQDEVADTCGISTRQTLVSIPVVDINESSLPPGTRILHPNSPMTMDFRADRLNIHVNADGYVQTVICG